MRRAALTVWCVAQLLRSAALAAEPPEVVRGLVRNAWYWQARGRDDKAEEAWKAVLGADPDHAEALAALGGYHARAGRLQQAREALAHLERVNAGHPDVPVLRRELELGSRYPALLAAARRDVHEGRTAAGVQRYRELFGAAGPPGDLALEYYQTIGGTEGGWQEARDGLSRLVRRAPAEARFRLALAKLLTYRDATRREGVATLQELSRDRSVAREATAAWRQALLWLGPAPADLALLRAYLRTHPGDAEVARRLDRGRRAGSVQEAYAALERGDLRAATELFRAAGDDPEAKRGLGLVARRQEADRRRAGYAALARGDLRAAREHFEAGGDDADARLGLALVAQREGDAAQRAGRFDEARAAYERARRLAPHRRDLWDPGLHSAEFWTLLHGAAADRGHGDEEAAEAKLRAALEVAPEADRWHAQLALGQLLQARRQLAPAEAQYRDVLAVVADQADALQGLASVLVASGRWQEALSVNGRLARVAPGRAFRPGWLRAEDLRATAAREREAGDLPAARQDLEAARAADGTDAWVLHDLAGVLLESGAVVEARGVVEALRSAAPAMPEARVLEARLLAAEGKSAQALEALARLPPGRDPSLEALRRRLEVEVQVPALVERAQRGDRAAAVRDLAALERRVSAEPQLAAAVAVAWSRMGEHGRALALMRGAMARAPRATRSQRLELASTLLGAGDDEGVATILSGLEHEPALSGSERRWLADLRVARAVRVADASRTRGDTRAAQEALDPVLRDYPDDRRVLAAQARLWEPNDPARAHAIWSTLLSAAPEDAEARRGAVDTALARGDAHQARRLADDGVRRRPDDPRSLLLAGRAAAAAGDDPAALRSLDRAAALVSAAPAVTPATSHAAAVEGEPRSAAAEPEAAPDRLRLDIAREADAVRARHGPGLGGAFGFRVRDGEPGLGQLTELSQTATGEVPAGVSGRFLLQASFVQLDGGAVSSDAASRFGTGGGAPADRLAASGVALRGAYEGRWFDADVGTTPLGFSVWSLVGGARVRAALGPVRLSAEGGRRSVGETLLSWAGTLDPGSGRTWGGVVADGGRGELAFAPEGGRLYAYGGYHRFVGFNVADNQAAEAGLGGELRVLHAPPFGDLLVGVAGHGMSYEKNLRYFTFGHGGYFSPQWFVRGTVPITWRHQGGRVRAELSAAPGAEWFREDAAPVLPLEGSGDTYPGQTTSGLAFEARAAVAWRIAGQLEAGLDGALQEAPEYFEARAAVVLRWGSPPPARP